MKIKKNSKKAVVIESSFASIILFVIALLVLLYTTGIYKVILLKTSEDIKCEASFLASALLRPLGTIGNPSVDPQCKVNKYTVVLNQKEDIENQFILNKDYVSNIPSQTLDTFERVKRWNSNPDLSEDVKYSYFDDYSKEEFSNNENINLDSPTKEQKEYVRARYNLDKLFAEELARCWDIVGQGKLDLFDNWFSFIDCNSNLAGIQECKNLQDWVSFTKNGNLKPTASFCVLCSRIKFDDEVKKFKGIKNNKYDSLARWMANNPVSVGNKKSYYDYVYNTDSYFLKSFPEYSTDKAYAVVFSRININTKAVATTASLTGVGAAILTFATGGSATAALTAGGATLGTTGGLGLIMQNKKEPNVYYANRLMLIPYEDISKECDFLVASDI